MFKSRKQCTTCGKDKYGTEFPSFDGYVCYQCLLDDNQARIKKLEAEIDEIHATGGTSYMRLEQAEAENKRLRSEIVELKTKLCVSDVAVGMLENHIFKEKP